MSHRWRKLGTMVAWVGITREDKKILRLREGVIGTEREKKIRKRKYG
jgi:hypothetical protein